MSLKTFFRFSKKEPPRHKTAADLDYAFTDLDGKRYYKMPPVMTMPLERLGKIQDFVMYMNAGMTADNIKKYVLIAETEIENLVRGIPGSLTKASVALNEIKLAADIVIHTELLYHFIAVHYIREDEDPFTYSEKIQEEKVEMFKRLNTKKHSFFLNLPELKSVSKFLDSSPEELDELLADCQKKIKRQEQTLKALESMQRLGKGRKTSIPKS